MIESMPGDESVDVAHNFGDQHLAQQHCVDRTPSHSPSPLHFVVKRKQQTNEPVSSTQASKRIATTCPANCKVNHRAHICKVVEKSHGGGNRAPKTTNKANNANQSIQQQQSTRAREYRVRSERRVQQTASLCAPYACDSATNARSIR